jgi:hypothetical protein
MAPIAIPATRHDRTDAAITTAVLVFAVLAASVLPVVFGLAFLGSARARRPLMATVTRHWHWLGGGHPEQDSSRARRDLSRLTVRWGVAFLVIGAFQGIGAVLAGLSVTDPVSVGIRALLALAVYAIMCIRTAAYLRHRRAAEQAATAGH